MVEWSDIIFFLPEKDPPANVIWHQNLMLFAQFATTGFNDLQVAIDNRYIGQYLYFVVLDILNKLLLSSN